MSRRPQAVDTAWPNSPGKALPGIVSDAAAVSLLRALQQEQNNASNGSRRAPARHRGEK